MKEFVSAPLKISMENNVFIFNDECLHQLIGSAMGTKAAPSYANLTVAYLEDTLYATLRNVYDKGIAEAIQRNWMRYLDDCIIQWLAEWGDIKDFHRHLNNLHPSINFTIEQRDSCLPFLDISIFRNGSIKKFDIYKETDSFLYNYVFPILSSVAY